jgi:two-component system sensor histidine kinase RegB
MVSSQVLVRSCGLLFCVQPYYFVCSPIILCAVWAFSKIKTNNGRGKRVNLQTLIFIRWLAVLGQVTTLLGVYYGLGLTFNLPITLLLVTFLAIVNLVYSIKYPQAVHLDEGEVKKQLALDLVQLSALLYFTGGLINPFSLLLLVPVTVSATILSQQATRHLLLFALLLCLILAFFHDPLPWKNETIEPTPIYIMGLWIGLGISMMFLTHYVGQVATEARVRGDALVATEDALAQEEQRSAVGALATTAAHELGTPLGTIALTTKELLSVTPKGGDLYEDIKTIDDQVERCREILANLSKNSHDIEEDYFAIQSLDIVLQQIIASFTGGVIDINIVERENNINPLPTIRKLPEIMHGITNFVENGVKYAQSKVEINIGWTNKGLILKIIDDGPGFDERIILDLGEPYIKSKFVGSGRNRKAVSNVGQGLGIFMGKSLIERTGATITFKNSTSSGAEVSLMWPKQTIDTMIDTSKTNER